MARYLWFKGALIALLAANAFWYATTDTFNKALDSAAWLTLLILFELETSFGERLRARFARSTVHGVRLFAAGAVVAAAIRYVYDDETLDAINSWVWIGVVILLEIEVRYAAAVTRHRAAFIAAASALYSTLAIMVIAWARRGEWFDAYDALLWLIAFATLELNLLRIGVQR